MKLSFYFTRSKSKYCFNSFTTEYARFLHSKLDTPLVDLDIDSFQSEFKDRWTKQLPFHFKKTYKEQPGLQPEIK